MKNLTELPTYLIEELNNFLEEPNYVTGSEFLIIDYKGVQVSLKFERDKDEYIQGKPKFKVKP